MRYALSDSLRILPGVGPKTAEALAQMGLVKVEDILNWLPRAYLDASAPQPISEARPGKLVALMATVDRVELGRTKQRGLTVLRALLSDSSGSIQAQWFNQPYLKDKLSVGSTWTFVGQIGFFQAKLVLQNPLLLRHPEVLPRYPQTSAVNSRLLRSLISLVLETAELIPEPVPQAVAEQFSLLSIASSYKGVHAPVTLDQAQVARSNLAFREVWEYFLGLEDHSAKDQKGLLIPADIDLLQKIVAQLPFELTPGQKRVIWDAAQELASGKLMTRLLNGDVGSGKTIVAGVLTALVQRSGWRSLVMAPTEILAEQHYRTLHAVLQGVGVSVGIRTANRKENLGADVVVGTHALLSTGEHRERIGLVVVDEQHRFGVKQRALLREEAEVMPHVLSMTATPIPRTLALTLFSGLQVSFLKGRPATRKEIRTNIVRSTQEREGAYRDIDQEIKKGHQVFVVCPAITAKERKEEDGEFTLFNAPSQSKKAVEEEVAVLKKRFPEARVAAVHGKMSGREKQKVMDEVVRAKVDILVATSVIEVGVDVPNATILMIEGAEYFGLAQLHQLRGRIGRGDLPGTCYLCATNPLSGSERLEVLATSTDGFLIAEADLAQRGPGDLHGLVQAGLPEFRAASLTDLDFLRQVRSALDGYIASNPEYLESEDVKKRMIRRMAVQDTALLE